MPGPGPHLMYAMGSGVAMMKLSNGRFGPHHTLTYAVNSFFGPDIGSFSEWLGSFFSSSGSVLGDAIHDPVYYFLILGLPLTFLYSLISRFSLRLGILDSFSGVPLSKRQCFLLIVAGSLSHFFLDHLFEENGRSKMYTWILSTGWWKGQAPVNPDAVFVVGFLCISLLVGFVYINRVMPVKSAINQSYQSAKLILTIASLYCLWCASQIYWVTPRRAPVGEEADLGILVFLAINVSVAEIGEPHSLAKLSGAGKVFQFLPHSIVSVHNCNGVCKLHCNCSKDSSRVNITPLQWSDLCSHGLVSKLTSSIAVGHETTH
ncbi:hypothetical protein QYF36_014184 [Acer negundo]|nr:hypothetical protein QYF36_014184 [Acer negundo]